MQDGQASTNAIFGTVGNSAPGLDAVDEIQVLSNSFSADTAVSPASWSRRSAAATRITATAFYDFNNEGLNALTYNQKLSGVERGDPLSKTHDNRWGGSFGGPIIAASCSSSATTRARTTRPSTAAPRHRADAGHAERRLQRTELHPNDPLTGEEFPPDHSGQSVRPGRAEGDEFLLSAAQSERHGQRRLRRVPAVHARDP